MGQRGRKPVPRQLKLLRGTLKPSRDRGELPGEQLQRLPKAPSRLGKAAQRYWRELGRRLVRLGVLRDVDLVAFELLCDWLGRAEEIRVELDRLPQEERYLMKTRGGRIHPLVKVLQQVETEATRLLVEFGLTPSARQRVSALPTRNEDDLLRELFGFN